MTPRTPLLHIIVPVLALLASLASCYNDRSRMHDALTTPDAGLALSSADSVRLRKQQDSISFTTTHHYTLNYNFIVHTDTIRLSPLQPEEIVSRQQQPRMPEGVIPDGIILVPDTDTIVVLRDDRLVVADIRILPSDTVDSVWIQVARDQQTFGWIHESSLLPHVVPDDPISKFILFFSDVHLLWTLVAICSILVAYTLRFITRRGARIVLINDIPSFYPTLLIILLSLAATVYSSIQLFAPEMWRHFYYPPTLNPFDVPPMLAVFLTLVWSLPIVGVATLDDVSRHLPVEDAILYLCGLAAVCLVVYALFSVTTLYYIGYPLLLLFILYSVRTFYRHRRLVYYCGRCGKAITDKGRCPHCGALNV